MAERREQFHFGPRDRRGLLAGVRTSQLSVVAVALVAAVLVMRTINGPARGPVPIFLVLAAIASVTWPIKGRSLEEWAPVAARFVSRAISGSNRQAWTASERHGKRRPPGMLAQFEVEEDLADSAEAIGVLQDGHGSTSTAVIALGGESFALLGERDRMRRIESWSGVLASVARDSGSIHRLTWIERTLPDAGESLRAHLERRLTSGEATAAEHSARVSYRQLLEQECSQAFAHELYLAVSVRAPRAGALLRRRSESLAIPSDLLMTEVALIDERCRQAGIEVTGVLSPSGLKAMLHRSFDVVPRLAPMDWPWPVAFETTWTAIRTDGLCHATFWVSEWPRHEVGNDFLTPLLVGTNCRRSVAVVMAPVPPMRAVRTAEHARTSRTADAELRRRHGFALTARNRREHDAVVRREQELASGHAAFRYSAFVTVSAPERDELERDCRRVVHAAALCGLDLRRLFGTQADAFCCTLPAGRGCE